MTRKPCLKGGLRCSQNRSPAPGRSCSRRSGWVDAYRIPAEPWDPGIWTRAEAPLDTAWITAVGANASRLFVGTNHAFFASAGDSFIRPLDRPRMGLVWRIAVSGETVLADGTRHISLDGGVTWAEVPVPPPWAPDGSVIGTVRRVTPAGPNLFAYATGGNFVSTDRGATWNPFALADTPLVLAAQGSARLACSRTACSASADSGNTWRASDFAPLASAFSLLIEGDSWVMHGEQPAGTLFLSRDRGVTWSESPRKFTTVEAAVLAPDGSLFVVDMSSGLHRSGDFGTTWREVAAPPAGGEVPGIKSAAYFSLEGKESIWVGTTKGLWSFPLTRPSG